MMQIKCEECTNHCCGQNPYLTPVLLPSEEEQFKKNSKKIKTNFRDIFVLAKKENGNCIFLNDKTTRCTIYEKRPFECLLYPFLLDFDSKIINIKLDERFCPHLNTPAFDKKKIIDFIRKKCFPIDWIKGYNTLNDF